MSLLKSCGYFYKHGAPGALVENAGKGEGENETQSWFRNCIHFSRSAIAKCTYASSRSSCMQLKVKWHRNSSWRRSKGLSVSSMLRPSYVFSSSLYLLALCTLCRCHPASAMLFAWTASSKSKQGCVWCQLLPFCHISSLLRTSPLPLTLKCVRASYFC